MKAKYIPDMATVVRETDPRKVKAERQKAREDAQRPTPPGFFASYDAATNGIADPARVSAPSPWANGATLGIDKETLPSAMGPERVEKGTAEAEAPRTPVAPTAAARRRIEGKHVAVAVALGLAVGAFAVAMPKLLDRGPRTTAGVDTAHAAEPGASPRPSATPSPTTTPSASAAPAAMTMPSATAAPSATATGTAPSRGEPKAPGSRSGRPREAGDDPYELTVPTPPTAPPPAPGAPTAPPSAPPPQPTTAPSASASGNHFDKPNYD
jgi:hypothetical protein